MKKAALLCAALSTAFLFTGCAGSTPNGEDKPDDKPDLKPPVVEYEQNNYTNPLKILKQDGTEYFVTTADPDIILGDDGYFYMYPTNCQCEMGNKGMMFDRGPIFKSSNMTEWTWCGSVFDGHPDAGNWGTKDAGVWAPSVVKIGDKYNYYYSLSSWGDPNPGIGVAVGDTPNGPWKHYGKVVDQVDSGVRNGIDPKVLIDDDKVYMVWGSFFGIACIQLTDDGIEPFYNGDELKNHLTYIIADNTNGGDMNIDINYEGSYIIKHNGYYYFFGSQGTCLDGMNSTYNVKVGKSESLFGPYLDSEGKELARESNGDLVVGPSETVAGTGHNAVIQDLNGDWWLVYHGFYGAGENSGERSLFIDKLLWDPDTGMPYVEGKIPSTEEKLGPKVYKK
ncbi:MAG: family 43 glycosylhydrolase [Clostridiales bacterium]|nr:family 43 glycosylhydrolase [Clostridiales bacterium]